MKILVTGANGQLGRSLRKIKDQYPEMEFIFTDIEELDITDIAEVNAFFNEHNPDFCINTAAYTNVDKAETEQDINYKVNVTGPENLAIACRNNGTKLIHISSDYVYNNDSDQIMTEEHKNIPKGEYAKSKLEGENKIKGILTDFYIIRTSWLYSEFGNNFVQTIIRLCKDRKELNVVNDQIGSPTYATDLAYAIMKIIKSNKDLFGVYNFSNEGFISWYDFAKKIVEIKGLDC
ncbi:MAG TPA: dTDP-4-dehydrorhamnose reductase, partial [Bacteroidetes bacterium]|nr:dTDP-4-dehydrorhamnose reductase [Bacteroidota bacterium]